MDCTPIPDSWIIARHHIPAPVPQWTWIGRAPAIEHLPMQRVCDPRMQNTAIIKLVIIASGGPLSPCYLIQPILVYGQGQAGELYVRVERDVCPVEGALLVSPVTYTKDGVCYTVHHQKIP